MRLMIGITVLLGGLSIGVCNLSVVMAQELTSKEIFNKVHSQMTTEIPQSYEGQVGTVLFNRLHHITGQNYKQKSYGVAKQYMYDVVDNKSGRVHTAYSGVDAARRGHRYFEEGDANLDGTPDDFVNCEHIWPQSKFSKQRPMVSDIHQLFSTFSKPNGMRGSFAFGEVVNPRYSTKAGAKQGGNLFEPQDNLKGNVARAMLYFMVRYHNRPIFRKTDKEHFWNSRIAMFLKWNREDPPDDWELARNERVEKFQGNRNPFIDEPDLADRIGREAFMQIYRQTMIRLFKTFQTD
tara:strand:- start:585 stop:1463 length:879 start_codon:yes stop_codon:yes gene_type:complete